MRPRTVTVEKVAEPPTVVAVLPTTATLESLVAAVQMALLSAPSMPRTLWPRASTTRTCILRIVSVSTSSRHATKPVEAELADPVEGADSAAVDASDDDDDDDDAEDTDVAEVTDPVVASTIALAVTVVVLL
jgi:hypothetical protein